MHFFRLQMQQSAFDEGKGRHGCTVLECLNIRWLHRLSVD